MSGRWIAVVLGTRPEIVKLAPVVGAIGTAARVVHTGQHYDPALSADLFRSCGMPAPAYRLEGVGGASRPVQVMAILQGLHDCFSHDRPAAVIVQGDTNSANAGAQAAHYLGIPVVHVEAGLRSYDRAMPEEVNRLVVAAVADVHCCATPANARTLLDAGTTPSAVHVTGNTIVEATRSALPVRSIRLRRCAESGATPGGYVLATLHRPENTDQRARLAAALDGLGRLGLPVLLSVHPRTRAAMAAHRLRVPDAVVTLPPLDHPHFLALAAEARLLVSDSGGVQEETTVLGKPLVVVRNSTERQESVDAGFAELCRAENLVEAAARLLRPGWPEHLATLASPFGDGRASERIGVLASGLAGLPAAEAVPAQRQGGLRRAG